MEKDDRKKYVVPEGVAVPPLGSVESYPDKIVPVPTVKKLKVGPKKKLTITFRHNRTFELHIGQEVMRFEGRETKQIDKSILEHPAFIQAKKYFIIKGI